MTVAPCRRLIRVPIGLRSITLWGNAPVDRFALPANSSEVFLETSFVDACHDLAAVRSLFPLRGSLARPHPSRRGDRHRIVDRRHQCDPELLVQWILHRAAEPRLGRLRPLHPGVLRAGRDLHGGPGVPKLSQSLAADPLAALHDADLSAAMAQHRQPLSHAASRRRRRQPRSAYRRRSRAIRAEHAVDRGRAFELDRDAVLLRVHSLEAVGATAAACVRQGLRHSRLPGLGGADLRSARHNLDAPDRLAAHPAQLSATALRGRLPFQSGANAREFRAGRSAARRGGRARAPQRPFRSDRR